MGGIIADIHRAGRADFSNGGISGRVTKVTVVDPAIKGPFEPSDDAPEVRIVVRDIGGRRVVHLEPVDRPEGKLGPMMGGCYVATSDSRFRDAIGFYGAVALHDRFETQAEYDALSI